MKGCYKLFLSVAKIRCQKNDERGEDLEEGKKDARARTDVLIAVARDDDMEREKERRNTYITYKPAIGPWMSRPRTQRHTKLAQYVIQPKNTPRSRHFAPRMRVSKGIKDSKASFAQRA